MKMTLLALGTSLLLAAGPTSAQTYYYDYGYGDNPQYYSYDSDRDGIEDRYDRYDNRYDRYDRYGDRDCDGVPNRYDYNDRDGNRYDRDCDGIPNRFDRIDNRTYRARVTYRAPTRYVTPYGYRGYTTYRVGSYLPRGYYGSSYYVDYRPYGLSPPPYGYTWVRVGNDVYMVRNSNGLVAEVVYSLFH